MPIAQTSLLSLVGSVRNDLVMVMKHRRFVIMGPFWQNFCHPVNSALFVSKKKKFIFIFLQLFQHCFRSLWSLTSSIDVGGCWFANTRTVSTRALSCWGLSLKRIRKLCLVPTVPFSFRFVMLLRLVFLSSSLWNNFCNQISFFRIQLSSSGHSLL